MFAVELEEYTQCLYSSFSRVEVKRCYVHGLVSSDIQKGSSMIPKFERGTSNANAQPNNKNSDTIPENNGYIGWSTTQDDNPIPSNLFQPEQIQTPKSSVFQSHCSIKTSSYHEYISEPNIENKKKKNQWLGGECLDKSPPTSCSSTFTSSETSGPAR